MTHQLQAIRTQYIGPSNVRGSRIKATASAGSITLPYDGSMGTVSNHIAAAIALANKFQWRGAWYGGGLADGSYVFTCAGLDGPSASPDFLTHSKEA